MSTWVIISWVLVLLLTGINVFIFLKLKQASEQMMKLAFPNAKNMGDAMSQMQNMMQGMGGSGAMSAAMQQFNKMSPAQRDAQLKAAMEMLKKR